jgi:hypothetical protein
MPPKLLRRAARRALCKDTPVVPEFSAIIITSQRRPILEVSGFGSCDQAG